MENVGPLKYLSTARYEQYHQVSKKEHIMLITEFM
jgi:hypothetical protein